MAASAKPGALSPAPRIDVLETNRVVKSGVDIIGDSMKSESMEMGANMNEERAC